MVDGVLQGEEPAPGLAEKHEIVSAEVECLAHLLDRVGSKWTVMVVLLPDHGRGYLSKIYDDDWMRAHGFDVVDSVDDSQPLLWSWYQYDIGPELLVRARKYRRPCSRAA